MENYLVTGTAAISVGMPGFQENPQAENDRNLNNVLG